MPCRGVHFALTEAEVEALRRIDDEQERLEFLASQIEEQYFGEEYEEYLAESDKAWDAMHRALSDGSTAWDGGEYPLNHVVLAGESLYDAPDYVMSLKSPSQVRDIAAALPAIDKEQFRQRYLAIDVADYGLLLSGDDFEYTWEYFEVVRRLYLKAASESRYVLFTVDQ